jgi:hypothetical protein
LDTGGARGTVAAVQPSLPDPFKLDLGSKSGFVDIGVAAEPQGSILRVVGSMRNRQKEFLFREVSDGERKDEGTITLPPTSISRKAEDP